MGSFLTNEKSEVSSRDPKPPPQVSSGRVGFFFDPTQQQHFKLSVFLKFFIQAHFPTVLSLVVAFAVGISQYNFYL